MASAGGTQSNRERPKRLRVDKIDNIGNVENINTMKITSGIKIKMNIGIIHYRAGKTDGVSLEITKRKAILENLGHSVKVISGPESIGSDYVIPELEFECPEIQKIKTNSFSFFNDTSWSEDELLQNIWQVSRVIENQFYQINNQEKFDLLLAHNIFSHGRHIAAASAFSAVIRNLGIPCLATNHDYFWEREEYQDPRFSAISDYLEEYVPFKSELITYISINSIAAGEFEKRTGLKSEVFPDIFDFEQAEWGKDAYNLNFLTRLGIREHDLVILQATRIVPRKAIESVIYLTEKLSQQKEQLIGKTLYNGKKITADSRVVLLIAGYAEKSSLDYLKKIQKMADQKVDAVFASNIIDAKRSEGNTKIYSLWDAYVFADLVTYPSLAEGWGNQFIEAVFAKKTIVLFEYPVFKTDISREGYSYVSLGDEVESIADNGLVKLPESAFDQAVERTIKTLISGKTEEQINKNFVIGKQFHGFQVLEKFLKNYINSLKI